MGCIRHVYVPGQQSMVTMGGCASFSRALGVSQILVLGTGTGTEPVLSYTDEPCTGTGTVLLVC